MVNLRQNSGVTLVEMLVVLGIIMVLSGIVATLTLRVDNQSKENVLTNTFALLGSALEQFHEYEYRYPPRYAEFGFPLDCDGFSVAALGTVLGEAVGATNVQITNHVRLDGREYLEYSGCEALFFLLSQVPAVRETLSRVSPALVTGKNEEGGEIKILNNGRLEPLLRVVDPWGTTLRYDYYDVRPADVAPLPETQRTFPVLISAGPDKQFDTGDDISSKGKR